MMRAVRLSLRKNNACLLSVHNRIRLSRNEQVCLMRLRFERYFSHHRRNIFPNVTSLNILVHDVINLRYFIYLVQIIHIQNWRHRVELQTILKIWLCELQF